MHQKDIERYLNKEIDREEILAILIDGYVSLIKKIGNDYQFLISNIATDNKEDAYQALTVKFIFLFDRYINEEIYGKRTFHYFINSQLRGNAANVLNQLKLISQSKRRYYEDDSTKIGLSSTNTEDGTIEIESIPQEETGMSDWLRREIIALLEEEGFSRLDIISAFSWNQNYNAGIANFKYKLDDIVEIYVKKKELKETTLSKRKIEVKERMKEVIEVYNDPYFIVRLKKRCEEYID